MGKLKFSKEEIKNLHKMLISSDEENHTIALSGLQGIDIESSMGELILLYKYGNAHPIMWETHCPKVWKVLNPIMENFKTGSQTLSAMTENGASKQSVELFLEFFMKDITYFLNDMGYPMEKFELNIKLKNGK